MNRKDDAFMGMYKDTSTCLTDYSTVIAGVPILVTYAGNLSANIDSIGTTSEQTAKKTQGITQTKATAKGNAVTLADIVGGALKAYAVDQIEAGKGLDTAYMNGDVPVTFISLSAEADLYTKEKLNALSDEKLPDQLTNCWTTASTIQDVTAPATSPLIPYGIVPDTTGTPPVLGRVTQLENAITAYSGQSAAPKTAIGTRKVANVDLDNLFIATNALLDKMDRVVVGLQDTQPAFVAAYQQARLVYGPKTMTTQIVGTVMIITDTTLGTTKVVQGAAITMVGTPYTKMKDGQKFQIVPDEVDVKTDVDGNYAGPIDFRTTYKVTCSLAGYVTQTTPFVGAKKGKKTEIDFTLVPIPQAAS